MAMKRWEFAPTNKALAQELANECDADPFIALIAAARGYNDAALLEEYLSPELIISDYRELADIEKAADIINDAITNDELIAIYGDYDCDGITATALLYTYLSGRGARVIYYIPNRIDEGYGMHAESVEALHNKGVNTIITVDNGIAANSEIELANSLGMRVVVTDHHIPQGQLPDAAAVVDPHREDCPSSFKDMCGVAVAFKLVCALEDKPPEQMLPLYADFVAIGTIGDVMPLVSENRSIVKFAIRLLRYAKIRAGVSALIQLSAITRSTITAGKIAFSIVPRINAAGRMGDAQRAVKLLIEQDIMKALSIAQELSDENTLRQESERKIIVEAQQIIEQNGYNYDRVIVVAGRNWHQGVVGIVAGKLTEHYGKPTIVFSCDNDTAVGSGRSFKGFSLFDAISAVKDLTQRFGGHELAAGVTIGTADIDSFRTAINEYAQKQKQPSAVLHLDCRLNPAALNIDIAAALEDLEPFGMGNSQPLFAIMSVRLERITSVGSGKHLRLLFSKERVNFQAMLFGANENMLPFTVGDTVDLAVQLDINNFNGEQSLSVIIKGIRKSGIDEDMYFDTAALYDDLKRNLENDYTAINPTREEIGVVYKSLLGVRCNEEKIKNQLYPSLCHYKTQVALDVLCELGLADRINQSGVVSVGAINGAPKSDLSKSQILKFINKG